MFLNSIKTRLFPFNEINLPLFPSKEKNKKRSDVTITINQANNLNCHFRLGQLSRIV